MERDLSLFDSQVNIRVQLRAAFWQLFETLIFKNIWCPSIFRVLLLRSFGAKIGKSVLIRSHVKVHFPWNLEIGNNCWIGREVWFINHDKIKVEEDVCISQRAVLCSSGHDYRSASLEYAHKPIEVKSGSWVCLDAKVLSGVTIGECSVVSAGEVARASVPGYSMLVGGEIHSIDLPK